MKTLRTARLILEPLRERHARALYRGLREPGLYRWIPIKRPKSLAALRESFRTRSRGVSPDGTLLYFNWALRRRDGGGWAGRVEATLRANGSANLAYIIFKKHRGRGFAREATEGMVEHLFTRRDCLQVEAGMDEPNSPSWRVAESLGLRRVRAARGERRYELRKNELLSRGLKLRAEGKLQESRTLLLWLAAVKTADAGAQYQSAWAHDLLGLERQAIPFYERAIRLGLSGKDLEGAILGLGSSLRCVGRARRAAAVLREGRGAFSEKPRAPGIPGHGIVGSGPRSQGLGAPAQGIGGDVFGSGAPALPEGDPRLRRDVQRVFREDSI